MGAAVKLLKGIEPATGRSDILTSWTDILRRLRPIYGPPPIAAADYHSHPGPGTRAG